MENLHKNHILHTTTYPANIGRDLAVQADRATHHREALDYVGVMAVEMFVADGSELLINEIAPRPHNSGHWTIDAWALQFEQVRPSAACRSAIPRPFLGPNDQSNRRGWKTGWR